MALALGAVGDPEGVQLGILQAKPDSHHLRPGSLLALSIPVQFPAGAVLAAQGAAFRTGIARQQMSFRIQQFRPQLTLAAIRVNKEMIACIGQFSVSNVPLPFSVTIAAKPSRRKVATPTAPPEYLWLPKYGDAPEKAE